MKEREFVLLCAYNDPVLLNQCLKSSPDVASGRLPLIALPGQSSAGATYNSVLEGHQHAIRILIHQDVYLPEGWLTSLTDAINALEAHTANWGALGVAGMTGDGQMHANLWSTGIWRHIRTGRDETTQIESLDEVLLVVRDGCSVAIDEAMGYHIYGTDLVQTLKQSGQPSFFVNCPLIHHDQFKGTLGASYFSAYRQMNKKWRDELPLPTTCMPVTRWGMPFLIRELKFSLRPSKRRTRNLSLEDLPDFSRELGFTQQVEAL